MKTVLVIALTRRHFLNHIPERFGEQPVVVYSSGTVISKDVRYSFISDIDQLRGHHGVEVEFWGPIPPWALEPKAQHEIIWAKQL